MKSFFQKSKEIINLLSWENRLAILFSQPFLILLLPRTYWRLFKDVFSPIKINKYVTGFSPRMAVIFTWYLRIADCIKKYGRNGYVYEDGLGFSLKERFWLNPFTLKVYDKLRIQKFTLLTFLILISSISIIGILEDISLIKLIILIVLIGGSPIFLIPFFRLAKPETISWAFFPLAFYTFFKGYYFISAIFCFGIAILNFTTTLFLAEAIFLFSLFSGSFIYGIMVLLAPAVKLLFDLIPFIRKSLVVELLEVLGGRKSKTREEKILRLRPNNLYLAFFYSVFLVSFIIDKAPLIYFIVLISPLILLIINQNFFRFSDDNTFYRFFALIGLIFLLLRFNPLIFIGYLTFIYLSPLSLMETIENVPNSYPHLKTYSLEQSKKFFEYFFNRIPSFSRIIFEQENMEKSLGGFRPLFTYFEYIFLQKHIELLPGEWLRLTQMDYFMKEYIKINKNSPRETIEEKIKELGGDYIMVHSEDFADNLKKWGYKEIGILKWEELKEVFWGSEEIMEYGYKGKDLYLLQPPFGTSRIEPSTQLKIEPNKIEFEVKGGVEYVIKYNYHSSWQAFQNGKEAKIYKAKGKLSFLALESEKDGKVLLKFNTNLLN